MLFLWQSWRWINNLKRLNYYITVLNLSEIYPSLFLYESLVRIALLQREPVDRLSIQDCIQTLSTSFTPQKQLEAVALKLGLRRALFLSKSTASAVPALLYAPSGYWLILKGQKGSGVWIVEEWDRVERVWHEREVEDLSAYRVATISLKPTKQQSTVLHMIMREFFANKRLLTAIIIGSFMINLVALAVSFYTMQVYDRVVPSGSSQTLLVLTLGVFVAIFYEFIGKRIRARILESIVDHVDEKLSHDIYRRFLEVRLDQMPSSVGGLAAQMRGYETVRSFLSSATQHLMVDAPFAILFLVVIYMIAGWIAVIPFIFLLISLSIGFFYRSRIDALAKASTAASNFRTGLLVESVEGAETIKSGQGGWRMMSRWMNTTNEARVYELKMRNISEHSQFLVAAMQQLSYISIVASGALLIGQGSITMGGLIAISILSGRILTPVASIASLLVSLGHCKAALDGLNALWALERDHQDQTQPIILNNLNGHYRLEDVEVSYHQIPALTVSSLQILPGQKVGVVGHVGAGKTTLLRLLTGMHKPNEGTVFLDDVDITQISKPSLSECVAYVQQEGRLFSGSLRENLILGLLDPGDDAILQCAKQTGLLDHVILQHPKGLEQPIYEGGKGLSAGQRQLVHLTRAFLRQPKIWLLDEPTASMDKRLEFKVLSALSKHMAPDCTLVLVTHKPELLSLVDRVLVVVGKKIIMDGPRDQVLKNLALPQSERARSVT